MVFLRIFLILLGLNLIFSDPLFAQCEIKILVEKMHCPLCTALVRKAALSISGIESANVSLKDKTLRFTPCKEKLKTQVLKALQDIHYEGKILP